MHGLPILSFFKKTKIWLEQNTWQFCTKTFLMVYKIDWVYLLLCRRPICNTGSNDFHFKGSCLMSFERIFKRCKDVNTCSWNYIIASSLTNNDNLYQLRSFIAWLRFSRILRVSWKGGRRVELFTIFVLLFQVYLLFSQRECFGRRLLVN